MNHVLGIAADHLGWSDRFAEFATDAGIAHTVFRIECGDWLASVERFNTILWRPNLDPPYCEEAKEKIYFLESSLGKRVFPNWATFWHYDNKRAQYYFFRRYDVPTPISFISFSAADAMAAIEQLTFPIVSKTSGGAGGSGVRLLRRKREAMREVKRVFDYSILVKLQARMGMDLRWSSRSRNQYVLWQEFIPHNARDLRITVIGKRHVFAFWRNNRPNDFRASGSGLIDYAVEGVEDECLYCVELCRRHDFDTMAFDIVYKEDVATILEMSYAFNDQAIYNAPGHFDCDESMNLEWIEGHVWPQQLLVEYVCRSMATTAAARV